MLNAELLKVGLPSVLAIACALVLPASGGEAYYTSFENFTVGVDTIIGSDGWQGSYAGAQLHGIMSEEQHNVPFMGKAAFLGGLVTTASTTGSGTSTAPVFPYIRKVVDLDPLALNQEVATFGVTFGIKDSTAASLIPLTNRYKRDNFEFLIYNKVGGLLAGVQFDNTTLDTNTGTPLCWIWRVAWNGVAYQSYKTDYLFLPEEPEILQFRVNFRTNRWTATLGGVPLFQDVPFYTGTLAKNLGSVMVKMGVSLYSYNRDTRTTTIEPGDNYLLFDDYMVRTDPVTTTLRVSKTNGAAPVLSWNEEAGYSYQLQYSADCVTWKNDLVNDSSYMPPHTASHTASLTGNYTFTDTTFTLPTRRFYRVKSVSP